MSDEARADEVFGTCNTCGAPITKRQDDERHADEVWCSRCGIRFSLSNPGLLARTVNGSKTWGWTPSSPERRADEAWVESMADLEDKHGGFPGFSGVPGASRKGKAMGDPKRIEFELNSVKCFLTFADLSYGTPQGWAKPEYLSAAGYVHRSEVVAAELQCLKDTAFRVRQGLASVGLAHGPISALQSLLSELDGLVRAKADELAEMMNKDGDLPPWEGDEGPG